MYFYGEKMEFTVRLFLLISLTYLVACTNDETSDSSSVSGCTDIYSQQDIDSSHPFISENPKQLNNNPVSNNTGYLRGGVVGVKLLSNGVGMTIWSEYDNEQLKIYSNSISIISDATSNSVRWGAKKRIDADLSADAIYPAFYMNNCGGAIVTWEQNNFSWYRLFDSQTGWGAAESIDAEPSCEVISLNKNNNSVCLYTKKDTLYFNVYSRLFSKENGWTNPVKLDTNIGNAYEVSVGIDESGNAIATWSQFNGEETGSDSIRSIWANRYVASQGWTNASLVESLNIGSADSPQLIMDGVGNAYVSWVQYHGPTYLPGSTRTTAYFNHYSLSNGWGTERQLSDNIDLNTNVTNVSLDVNHSGYGAVVWNESPKYGYSMPVAVKGRRFNNIDTFSDIEQVSIGDIWDTSTALFYSTFDSGNVPVVAISENGTLVVYWSAPSTIDEIFFNKAEYNQPWADAIKVGDIIFDAHLPDIDIDNDGRVLLTWNQKIFGQLELNTWAKILP